MCGLYGVSISQKNTEGSRVQEIKDLSLLCMMNDSRGKHSTGIANGALDIYKKPLPAVQFAQHIAFLEVISNNQSNEVIGHTRYATMGEKNEENAHPWVLSEKLVGSHNGWLRNWEKSYYEILSGNIEKGFMTSHEIVSRIKDITKNKDFELPKVDSKAIYEVFLESGYDVSTFTKWHGSIALAYIYEGDLHLYRREAKPLSIGYKNNNLYYSSEPWPLKGIGCSDIIELDVDTLYRISNSNIISKEKLSAPEIVLPKDCLPSSFSEHLDPNKAKELGLSAYSKAKTYNHYQAPNSERGHGGSEYDYFRNESRQQELYSQELHEQERFANTGDNGYPDIWDDISIFRDSPHNIDVKVEEEQEIKEVKSKIIDSISKEGGSMTVVHFKDGSVNIPFSDCTIYPYGDDIGFVPNKSGVVGVPYKGVMGKAHATTKTTAKIVAKNPLTKKEDVFVIKGFPFQKNAVSEVTVSLPFRTNAQKNKATRNSVEKNKYLFTRVLSDVYTSFQVEKSIRENTDEVSELYAYKFSYKDFVDFLSTVTSFQKDWMYLPSMEGLLEGLLMNFEAMLECILLENRLHEKFFSYDRKERIYTIRKDLKDSTDNDSLRDTLCHYMWVLIGDLYSITGNKMFISQLPEEVEEDLGMYMQFLSDYVGNVQVQKK